MQVVELGPLSEAQKAEVEAGEEDPFGGADDPLSWRPKDLHVALRAPDGRLVASTGLLVADVAVAEAGPFEVVGVGGVVVTRDHRGRGLSRPLIEAALARAATLGPDRAMLFCAPHNVSLYERFGFAVVDGRVDVDQPGGTATMHQHTMWRALREGASWPAGRVRLHGLPF